MTEDDLPFDDLEVDDEELEQIDLFENEPADFSHLLHRRFAGLPVKPPISKPL